MSEDPYRYFRVEARELLEGLGRALVGLDRAPDAAARLAHALRLAHTLKGAANVVRLKHVAERAHALEDLLSGQREAGGPVPQPIAARALALLEEVSSALAAMDAPAPRAAAAAAPSAPELDFLRVSVGELNELLRALGEASVKAEALEQELRSHKTRSAEGATGTTRELRSLAGGLRRELSNARDEAGRLRLAPARTLFGELERAALATAAETGRKLRFEAEGGEERLDAAMLSALRGALQHLVRNAVIHGIEDPATRRASGKPEEGRVRIEVRGSGRTVRIACIDDGRGIDRQAVLRAAKALGSRGDGNGDRQGNGEQALDLIFRPGLSTAGSVSLVSGRGLGLDAVREAVRSVHGRVEAGSEPGRGARFELEVPVSLAVLTTLVVEDGGIKVALPLESVRQVRRLPLDDLARTSQGETVQYEGFGRAAAAPGGEAPTESSARDIPLVRLAALFGRTPARDAARRASKALVVVFLESDAARVAGEPASMAALAVGALGGVRAEIVHALPPEAGRPALVSGAVLDLAGRPCPLLAPAALVAAAGGCGTAVEASREAAVLPVLIIDDSLTTRMLEQSILESNGYEVDLACSGEEAMDLARRRRYGLFLVDVEMPGMDGFEFVERARADAALREVPAVLVTTLGSPEHRRRGLEAGAKAYMAKSEFDEAYLLRTVRALVG